MACLYSDRTASTPLASLEAPDKASEEDAEPRILSLPLKVCAYALALLPIPTDWLTGAAYAAALPPLPVERATNPKTCKPYRRACTDSRWLGVPSDLPRHRSSSSIGIISPRVSSSNLQALTGFGNNSKGKRVCFDRVTIIQSPCESDED
jgi:hypothetical protein